MERRIAGFRQDEASDWVAALDCGHERHTRHSPPLAERPWVASARERAARLGSAIDCGLCERRELPAHYAPYRRTRSFTNDSVPRALRERHTTAPGIWARIHVETGRLRYRVHEPFCDEQVLAPGAIGVVLPGVEHEVEPLGETRFFVEFLRPADASRRPATPDG